MKVEMVMPQMGESIAEATISKWLKGVGDSVEKDELILEISTDKVDSEIPAPEAGVIAELKFQEGDVVPVKTVIAIIDTEGVAAAPSDASTKSEKVEKPAGKATESRVPEATKPDAAPVVESNTSTSDRFYSPLVKSLAAKHGLSSAELDSITGSGQGGRVTKSDLLYYVENRGQQQVAVPSSTGTVSTPRPSVPAPKSAPASTVDWNSDGQKVVPMDKMRQIIAEHMVRSKQTSPHVYSVQEVDMSRVAKWRAKNKGQFRSQEGFNLSFTPFFLEAAVQGLVQFPGINASVEEKSVVLKKNINLGCAVALGTTGLIVPVIKKAEEKNLVGLARSLNDLALRARDKKLVPDEVMGGTFTVTNPGVFGTMIGTPIINQPQVGILCLGAIKKRPVVVDDMIAIKEICYLTLSYDHRVVDGAMGGQYLAFVREYLENWDMDRTL